MANRQNAKDPKVLTYVQRDRQPDVILQVKATGS
jgi:hypothetical protein